ncbi:MAG: response regulator transcription factor [Acidobacteria bacterium]|nr:response regulator transcription factor [Acidobacteriota bacterium]
MHQLKILIADDNESLRQALKELLELKRGWKVIGEAANGRDAIQKAEQFQPEVVLLDINMPEVNGLDAARQIHQTLPKVRLIILTVHDSPQMIREAFETGIHGYVVKSCLVRDLEPAIQAARQDRPFISGRGSVSGSAFARSHTLALGVVFRPRDRPDA